MIKRIDVHRITLFDPDSEASLKCLLACGDGHLFVAGYGSRLVVETLQLPERSESHHTFESRVFHGIFDGQEHPVCILRFTIGRKCICGTPQGKNVTLMTPIDDRKDFGLFVMEETQSDGQPRQSVTLQSVTTPGCSFLAFDAAVGELFLKSTTDRNDQQVRFSLVTPPADFSRQSLEHDDAAIVTTGQVTEVYIEFLAWSGGTVEFQAEDVSRINDRIRALTTSDNDSIVWVVVYDGRSSTGPPNVHFIEGVTAV